MNIEGDNRPNTLKGTSQDDVIIGLGGDDRLFGLGQNDYLFGDAFGSRAGRRSGNDLLSGGNGDDTLAGGAGNDTLDGGRGDDFLYNGFAYVPYAGELLLRDAAANYSRKYYRDGGDDNLIGGIGLDTAVLQFHRHQDISIDLSESTTTTVVLADGVAAGSLIGVERLYFFGDTGNDSVTGGALDDVLTGGLGNDRFHGGAGDDLLVGGVGDDVLDGGIGFDIADYSGARSGITINLGEEGSAQPTHGVGVDTLLSIESVVGSKFSDRLVGGTGDDTLDGGRGGDDRVDGGEGDDIILFYHDAVDAASSVLSGGAGNDTIRMNNVVSDQETLAIFGGDGDDVVTIRNIAHLDVDLGSGNDRITVPYIIDETRISLGFGVDLVVIDPSSGGPPPASTALILDFQTGDGGDIVDFTSWMRNNTDWPGPPENPFMDGFARLVQFGASTCLQVDRDGPSSFNETFRNLLSFDSHSPSDFTAFNFGGFAPQSSPTELELVAAFTQIPSLHVSCDAALL